MKYWWKWSFCQYEICDVWLIVWNKMHVQYCNSRVCWEQWLSLELVYIHIMWLNWWAKFRTTNQSVFWWLHTKIYSSACKYWLDDCNCVRINHCLNLKWHVWPYPWSITDSSRYLLYVFPEWIPVKTDRQTLSLL